MEWVTTRPEGSKKRRHVECRRDFFDIFTVCGTILPVRNCLNVDDPAAPKCKNCLRVLKRLIEG